MIYQMIDDITEPDLLPFNGIHRVFGVLFKEKKLPNSYVRRMTVANSILLFYAQLYDENGAIMRCISPI